MTAFMVDDNHQELIDSSNDDAFDLEESFCVIFLEDIFKGDLTGDTILHH
jgi:hypothetical protein